MDTKISGAVTRARGAAGDALSDISAEARDRVDDIKGKAVEGYGWAVDQAERLSQDLPAEFRDTADRSIDFARRKPLVTTGIIAGVLALLFGAAASRRR